MYTDQHSHVQDMALSLTQHLEVQKQMLSISPEDLWRVARAETKLTPLAYVKLKKSNILSLLVPPKAEEGAYIHSKVRVRSTTMEEAVSSKILGN